MKKFTRLFNDLEETNKRLEKINALVRYFESAGDEDKTWAIALLTGRRPRRTVRTNLLKDGRRSRRASHSGFLKNRIM